MTASDDPGTGTSTATPSATSTASPSPAPSGVDRDRYLQRLQPIIEHPLHRALGVTDLDGQDGEGRLGITVTPLCSSPGGGFHGGVIYLLCDVCAMVALLTRLDDGVHAVTHDIQVSVMRAAAIGERVDFRSRVVQLGRRLCFCEVTASVGERTIATAKITKSIVVPRTA
jgi:uncharacterized protein (TIGR00369 family)